MQTADSEKAVEAYLVKRTREAGGKAYKWVSPGNAGVPDRMCVFPSGVIRMAELKGKAGRVSPIQTRRFAELSRFGVPVSILWSKDDVDHFISGVQDHAEEK